MNRPDQLIQSPLNYTGGKYRLLPQLLPLFPEKVGLFVDLFCGGGNVGLNVAADRVLLNDADPKVMGLLRTFQTWDREELFRFLDQLICRYGLTRTDQYGYGHYQADSGMGIAEVNRAGYQRLRADFNAMSPDQREYYPTLYALVIFAFNNQLRFNSRGEFNLPVGKRDFNQNMRRKLGDFMDRLQGGDYEFRQGDFRALDPAELGPRDFVYADPPYLIATATYNEKGGWNEALEGALLDYLDRVHAAGARFALSNVLRSKGRENHVLLEWLRRNKERYKVYHLNYHYGNASYHTLDRSGLTDEVLIVNYRVRPARRTGDRGAKEGTGMPGEELSFRSYCWSLGTTSFRTRQFNQIIELQLSLLDEFWRDREDLPWDNGTQADYYRFMQERAFVRGDAPRPDKDAREKTSGLVTLGLLTRQRRLTPAGRALLALSRAGDFAPDNRLDLPKDSYLYLKQLLKASILVEGTAVRPYLVLVYLLTQLDYLTEEEFTYLLPLCVDRQVTADMVERIRAVRAGEESIPNLLWETVLRMDHYQAALRAFRVRPVDEDLICQVGLNRKSRSYDRPYYALYQALHTVVVEGGRGEIGTAFAAAMAVKQKGRWRELLFGRSSRQAVARDPEGSFRWEAFPDPTEDGFRVQFFRYLHLFKIQATLSDYWDLNRRYFRLTDTVLFSDGRVELDVVPRQFFRQAADALWQAAFEPCPWLEEDRPMEAVIPGLAVDEAALMAGLAQELGRPVATMAQARQAVRDERHQRFDRLIDDKFSDQVLLTLLDQFRDRADQDIQETITDNADVPTLFEYVLGILWYKLSGRQGDILDYMNLSLEADLLPRTHAGGGEADIVYQYDRPTAVYGPHTLLLEATLVNDTGQRRMEGEPVTRHLGRYLADHPGREAYCVFVSTYLDLNTLSGFRAQREAYFYPDRGDPTRYIQGMKIIPLSTDDLKRALAHGRTYEQLYAIFERAHQDPEPQAPLWQQETLGQQL